MNYYTIPILAIGLIFSFSNRTSAQDRQFANTYQSNTLPTGANELEAWATWSTGKNYFYNRLGTRIEFETGLTHRLQTSLYINAQQEFFDSNPGNTVDLKKSTSLSISNEWKWNIMNASVNPFGFALYAEFGYSPEKVDVETKLIFDKNMERNLFAFNLVNEYAIEYDGGGEDVEVRHEIEPEIDLAYMYLFHPGFGLGFELVNSNEIEHGNWNYSALFGGPTLFYSGEDHFFILNILPQWSNLHKTEDEPGDLVLNAREKIEVRILWGF